jgi:hypothetical protein
VRELNEQSQTLCKCGVCGLPAPIAKKTDQRCGHVKGQPISFITGHNARLQPRQDLTHFWDSVDMTTTPGDCWPWTGCRDEKGYGQISVNGQDRKAHHVALELVGFIIPAKGLQVRHYVCNNPPCCRPAHLRIGTPKEDTEDKISQGRQARGERLPQAVLTEALVLEIRAGYERGVRGRGIEALAKWLGVSHQTIRNVVNGKTWRHVEPGEEGP